MKLKHRTTSTVTTDTFTLEHEGHEIVYVEYTDERGKVVDCELRDSNGESIDDAALLEQVEAFTETNPAIEE